jgi:hypothetical protein
MADAQAEMPERKTVIETITLEEPICRDGGKVTELRLRKPRGGDLRGMKVGELMNGDVNTIIAVLPRISDPFITEAEAADLSAEDMAEIAGTLRGFFMTAAQKELWAKMIAGTA